jgi:hypothetical protein
MLSAFGVDHGDISKGVRLRSPFARTPKGKVPFGTRGPNGKQLTRAQRATVGTAGPTRPQRARVGMDRVLEAPVSIAGIGRGASRGAQAGTGFIERHPGLTGTALVGGGGAAGYQYLSNKEPRRKSSS